MNITTAQLRQQYEQGRSLIGELVDAAEKAFNLPPRVMWAIYSRETNIDPYYFTHPGDGGHGRGVGQVDDRSHDIPANWDSNLTWQVGKSAEIFQACLTAEGGDVIRAANRYNSGQGATQYTTGKDYGPDVYERWQTLLFMFPPATQQEEFSIMYAITNMNGLVLDVGGASTDNGAPVVQWGANGQKNQGVHFEGMNGEPYDHDTVIGKTVRILFDHSDKCLDGPPDAGSLVHQWEKADVPWQLWRIEEAPTVTLVGNSANKVLWQPTGLRIVNDYTDKVLDIEGISEEPGARLIQWDWNGQINQQFIISRFR